MEKQKKIETLKSMISTLEQKHLASEIDCRFWLRQSLKKASTQNTNNHHNAKGVRDTLQENIDIAKEMLAELEKEAS